MPALHVLRVFTSEEREWGNPLGIFLDGAAVPEAKRQGVAAELGFSETVFVEDRERGAIRIFTPEVELPFAGHPSVGTAWLLSREGTPTAVLRTPAGEVGARADTGTAHVSARAEWAPHFEYAEQADPAAVRALTPEQWAQNTYAWAWIDAAAGTIRARSFVPGAGIAEDEATGAAALALCAQLARPITVHQGRGSVIVCRPLDDGRVEIGGNVALSEVREY